MLKKEDSEFFPIKTAISTFENLSLKNQDVPSLEKSLPHSLIVSLAFFLYDDKTVV